MCLSVLVPVGKGCVMGPQSLAKGLRGGLSLWLTRKSTPMPRLRCMLLELPEERQHPSLAAVPQAHLLLWRQLPILMSSFRGGHLDQVGGGELVRLSLPPVPTCCRPDPKQLQETHSERGINKPWLRFFFFKAFSSSKMVQMFCVPVRLLCFFQSAGWAGYSSLLCSPLPA